MDNDDTGSLLLLFVSLSLSHPVCSSNSYCQDILFDAHTRLIIRTICMYMFVWMMSAVLFLFSLRRLLSSRFAYRYRVICRVKKSGRRFLSSFSPLSLGFSYGFFIDRGCTLIRYSNDQFREREKSFGIFAFSRMMILINQREFLRHRLLVEKVIIINQRF